MKVNYIIIQAGGLGSRLGHLTTNKPKALVSIENLPIIFHLFKKYPENKFIIIGDYKKDVLDRYLEAFAEVNYLTVGTDGKKGTCSGIQNAISLLPPETPFMLIWSDLILGNQVSIPDENNDYIGISGSFPCRWSYTNNKFVEIPSSENGVAGLFVFTDKNKIKDVPDSGEFVKWLQEKAMLFSKIDLSDTAEYGLLERINPTEEGKCRPFNQIEIKDGKLIKKGIDEQGRKLAEKEIKWYKYVADLDIAIPKIYSFEPLTMEHLDGKNVYCYKNLDLKQKKKILGNIVQALEKLHEVGDTFPDYYSIKQAYYDKTFDRLSKIRDLVPYANEKEIVINGKKCRNVFFHKKEVFKKISELKKTDFCLIHGDCTFSNIILRRDYSTALIDPRGYFGSCELVGDPRYDWAKLYYSVFGDYDQFNLGHFRLSFNKNEVTLDIDTNGWRGLEKEFFAQLPKDISEEEIKFIHALIWLSLTTYAWNDYDSICGAFYNGLYYLEDVL